MPIRFASRLTAALIVFAFVPAVSRAQDSTGSELQTLQFPVSPLAYPVASLIAGEEGSVRLVVSIDEDGDFSGARVENSSGYPALDEAAIAIANGSSLSTPPTNAAGETVSVDVYLDIDWDLPLEPPGEMPVAPEEVAVAGGTPPKLTGAVQVRARDFPAIGIRDGMTGAILLDVTVSAEGNAESVEVLVSSGYRTLDDAALAMIDRFRWAPGTIDGQSAQWRIEQVIEFFAVPGRQSELCYNSPLGLRATAVTVTGAASREPDVLHTIVAASAWIRADETGAIREGFLRTDDGWRRLSDSYLDAMNQESDIEAHVEDGITTACWYFRPLGQRGSQ